jgi:hypothetical protein
MVFAVLIIGQIGEDRCGESRIAELEGEVGPALVRLLRPSRLDLGAAEDAMAGGIVVGLVASDGMPSFFCDAASFSSAGVPDLLRGTFWVSHLFSRGCCSARTTASLWLIWPEDGCASIA